MNNLNTRLLNTIVAGSFVFLLGDSYAQTSYSDNYEGTYYSERAPERINADVQRMSSGSDKYIFLLRHFYSTATTYDNVWMEEFFCLLKDSVVYLSRDSSKFNMSKPAGYVMENSIVITNTSIFNYKPIEDSLMLWHYEELVAPEPIVVERPLEPMFPGGEAGLVKFVDENFSFETTRNLAISGVIYVRFVVNADGTVSNVHVAKGLDPQLDEEAVRVISMLPRWVPGEDINGQPVATNYVFPIKIEIQE